MRAVERKDHAFGIGRAQKPSRLFARVVYEHARFERKTVPAAAGIGRKKPHGVLRRIDHAVRLYAAGGGIVKIDHVKKTVRTF